jgi:hypothetical protein
MSANRLMMIALAFALMASTLPTTQAQPASEVEQALAELTGILDGLGLPVPEPCRPWSANVGECFAAVQEATGLPPCPSGSSFATDCIPLPVFSNFPPGDGFVASIAIDGAIEVGNLLVVSAGATGGNLVVHADAYQRDGPADPYLPFEGYAVLLAQIDCGNEPLASVLDLTEECQGQGEYVINQASDGPAVNGHVQFSVPASELVDAFPLGVPLSVLHFRVTGGLPTQISDVNLLKDALLSQSAAEDQEAIAAADSIEHASFFTPVVFVQAAPFEALGDGFVAHYEWPEGSVVTGTNTLAVPLDGDLVIGATLYERDGATYEARDGFAPGLLLEVDCGELAAAPGFADRCGTPSDFPGDQSNQGFIRLDVQDGGDGHFTFTAPAEMLASAFFGADPAVPVTFVHALIVPHADYESSSYSILTNTLLDAAVASDSFELFALADALDHSLWHPVGLASPAFPPAIGDGFTAQMTVAGGTVGSDAVAVSLAPAQDLVVTAKVFVDEGAGWDTEDQGLYSLRLWYLDPATGAPESAFVRGYPADSHALSPDQCPGPLAPPCFPEDGGVYTFTIPFEELPLTNGVGGFQVQLQKMSEDFGSNVAALNLFVPRDQLLGAGGLPVAPYADLMDGSMAASTIEGGSGEDTYPDTAFPFTPLNIVVASTQGDGYVAKIDIAGALPTADGALVLTQGTDSVVVSAQAFLRASDGTYDLDIDGDSLYSLAFFYVDEAGVQRFPPQPSPDFLCQAEPDGTCTFPAIARDDFPEFADGFGNGFSVDVTLVDSDTEVGQSDSYLFLPKEALLAEDRPGFADALEQDLFGPLAPLAPGQELFPFTPFFVTPLPAVGVPEECGTDTPLATVGNAPAVLPTCIAAMEDFIGALLCEATGTEADAAACAILADTEGDGFVAGITIQGAVAAGNTLVVAAADLTVTAEIYELDDQSGSYKPFDGVVVLLAQVDCGEADQPVALVVDGATGQCQPSGEYVVNQPQTITGGHAEWRITEDELVEGGAFFEGIPVSVLHFRVATDSHCCGHSDLNLAKDLLVAASAGESGLLAAADAVENFLYTPTVLIQGEAAGLDSFTAAMAVVGAVPTGDGGLAVQAVAGSDLVVAATVFVDEGEGWKPEDNGLYGLRLFYVNENGQQKYPETPFSLQPDTCDSQQTDPEAPTTGPHPGYNDCLPGLGGVYTFTIPFADLPVEATTAGNGFQVQLQKMSEDYGSNIGQANLFLPRDQLLGAGGASAAAAADAMDLGFTPLMVLPAIAGDGFLADWALLADANADGTALLEGDDTIQVSGTLLEVAGTAGASSSTPYEGAFTLDLQVDCGALNAMLPAGEPVPCSTASGINAFHVDSSTDDGTFSFTIDVADLAANGAFPEGIPVTALHVFAGDDARTGATRYSSFSLAVDTAAAADKAAADALEANNGGPAFFTPLLVANADVLPGDGFVAGITIEGATPTGNGLVVALGDLTVTAEVYALDDQTGLYEPFDGVVVLLGQVDCGSADQPLALAIEGATGQCQFADEYVVNQPQTVTGGHAEWQISADELAEGGAFFEDLPVSILHFRVATDSHCCGKSDVNLGKDNLVAAAGGDSDLLALADGLEESTPFTPTTLVQAIGLLPAGDGFLADWALLADVNAYAASLQAQDGAIQVSGTLFEIDGPAGVGVATPYIGAYTLDLQVDCGDLAAVLPAEVGCSDTSTAAFHHAGNTQDGTFLLTVPVADLVDAYPGTDLLAAGVPITALHIFAGDDGRAGATRYSSFSLPVDTAAVVDKALADALEANNGGPAFFTPVIVLGTPPAVVGDGYVAHVTIDEALPTADGTLVLTPGTETVQVRAQAYLREGTAWSLDTDADSLFSLAFFYLDESGAITRFPPTGEHLTCSPDGNGLCSFAPIAAADFPSPTGLGNGFSVDVTRIDTSLPEQPGVGDSYLFLPKEALLSASDPRPGFADSMEQNVFAPFTGETGLPPELYPFTPFFVTPAPPVGVPEECGAGTPLATAADAAAVLPACIDAMRDEIGALLCDPSSNETANVAACAILAGVAEAEAALADAQAGDGFLADWALLADVNAYGTSLVAQDGAVQVSGTLFEVTGPIGTPVATPYAGAFTIDLQVDCGELAEVLSMAAPCQDTHSTVFHADGTTTDGTFSFTVPVADLALAGAFAEGIPLTALHVFAGDDARTGETRYSSFSLPVDTAAAVDKALADALEAPEGPAVFTPLLVLGAAGPAGDGFVAEIAVEGNGEVPVSILTPEGLNVRVYPREFIDEDAGYGFYAGGLTLYVQLNCGELEPGLSAVVDCQDDYHTLYTSPEVIGDVSPDEETPVYNFTVPAEDLQAAFNESFPLLTAINLFVGDSGAGEDRRYSKYNVATNALVGPAPELADLFEDAGAPFTPYVLIQPGVAPPGTGVPPACAPATPDDADPAACAAALIGLCASLPNATLVDACATLTAPGALLQGLCPNAPDETVAGACDSVASSLPGYVPPTSSTSSSSSDPTTDPPVPDTPSLAATFTLPDPIGIGKVPAIVVGNESLTFSVHTDNVDADGNPSNYTGDLTFFVQVDCGALVDILGEIPDGPCMGNDEVVFQATQLGALSGNHAFVVPAGGLAAAFNLGLPASAVHLFVADDGSTGETRHASFALQAEVGYLLPADPLALQTQSAPFTPVLLLNGSVPAPGPVGVPAECMPSETLNASACFAAVDTFVGPLLCNGGANPYDAVSCVLLGLPGMVLPPECQTESPAFDAETCIAALLASSPVPPGLLPEPCRADGPAFDPAACVMALAAAVPEQGVPDCDAQVTPVDQVLCAVLGSAPDANVTEIEELIGNLTGSVLDNVTAILGNVTGDAGNLTALQEAVHGACVGASAEAMGAVDDVCAEFASESGDSPSLDITASDDSAGEPADHGRFNITRSGTETGEALAVSFTVSGTAVRGVRYELRDDGGAVLAADAVTIPAGKASVNVTVHVVDDDVNQGDQDVVLNITGNGFENGTKTASITIVDDELPPADPPALRATFVLPDGTPLGKVPVVNVGNESLTFEVHADDVDADGTLSAYTGDLAFFVQVDCGALVDILGEIPDGPCMADDEVVFQATSAGHASGDHEFVVPAGGLADAFNLDLPASAVHLFVADDGSSGSTRHDSFSLPAEVGYLLPAEAGPVAAVAAAAGEASFTPVLLVQGALPEPSGVPVECIPADPEAFNSTACMAAVDAFIGPLLCNPASPNPYDAVSCVLLALPDDLGNLTALPEGDGFVAAFWLPDPVETTLVPAVVVGDGVTFGVQPFAGPDYAPYTGLLTLHVQIDCGELEAVLAAAAPCMDDGTFVEQATLTGPNGAADEAPYQFTFTAEQLAEAFALPLPLSAVHLFVSDDGAENQALRYSSYSLPTEILLLADPALADALQANTGGPVPFTPVVLVGALPELPLPNVMTAPCGTPVGGPFDCPTLTLTPSGAGFNEGDTATYTVQLGGLEPTEDVTVTVASSLADVHAVPDTLTFTPAAWDTPQTVTVYVDASAVAQGTRSVTLTNVASGDEFEGLSGDVTFAVVDPVRPGVRIELPNGASIVQGHELDVFVLLASQPTSPVTVDLAFDGSVVHASPDTMVFTPESWDQGQPLRLRARETGAEGDVLTVLRFGAEGAEETSGYGSLDDAGAQSIIVRAPATKLSGSGLGSTPAGSASTSSTVAPVASSSTSTTAASTTTTTTTSTTAPPEPVVTVGEEPDAEDGDGSDVQDDEDVSGSSGEGAEGEGDGSDVVAVDREDDALGFDIPAPGIVLLALALLAVALVVRRRLQ